MMIEKLIDFVFKKMNALVFHTCRFAFESRFKWSGEGQVKNLVFSNFMS